jgi:sugar phosphate isomerase/epimerase
MKLGVYTAVMHDRSLRDALSTIASLGLVGAEINAGGFLPSPHLPIEGLLSGRVNPDEYLAAFVEAGVELTGLNANGNPLHADPEVGPEDAEDLRRAIEVASLLGVRRVVTMSGLPAAHPGGSWPAWHVNPWDSGYLDSLEYQWDDVAVPFWREIDALARDHDVKVCIEMHPQNLVFNPPTLQRLVDKTNASHIGAEMDPSHCSGRASTRWPRSTTWASWFFTPPPRTPGSTRRAPSTACSTTASRGYRGAKTRPVSVGGTP